MNITDIDDKTIRDSQVQKKSLKEFTELYTKAFFEDVKKLNIEKAEYYPKATDHIKEMVDLIQKLLDKGFAYKSEDGSIYFKVSKFPAYGCLAHIKVEELKAGARVKHDEYEKESVSDFALWKAWDENDGEVYWETELGKGRPGWHIECSAMSMKYLGETFDIHTGGVDNLFPHHENEVAQAEAATGKKFVNYWMHCEHLLVENKKMSKSFGNFYTLRDLLEKDISASSIRFLLLSTHYRQQLNFNFAGLEASKNAVQRLNDFALMLKNISNEGTLTEDVRGIVDNSGQEFIDAMDDDLNVSQALAVVFDMMKKINKVEDLTIDSAAFAYGQLLKFDSVLGVLDTSEKVLDEDIQRMIDEREHARLNKEYNKADMIRDMLKEKGIILEDTAEGIRWKRVL